MRNRELKLNVALHGWSALASALVVSTLLAGAAGDAAPEGSAYIDPYVARPRIVVMTDIANEPDDQMSMIRFVLYSNQWDVEGLVASTSTWMKTEVRPDVILSLVAAYENHPPA